MTLAEDITLRPASLADASAMTDIYNYYVRNRKASFAKSSHIDDENLMIPAVFSHLMCRSSYEFANSSHSYLPALKFFSNI